jgi:WD40 repeat protein/serine/threonine protein kinase
MDDPETVSSDESPDGVSGTDATSPEATLRDAPDPELRADAPSREGSVETIPDALNSTLCDPTADTLRGEPPGGMSARQSPAIPGYVILGELGRGGTSVVYHALQLRLNRACALKMILAGIHADPVTAIRFLGEAETVARVRHPNVVQIYSLNAIDGLPYFELEYVDGGSLEKKLNGTPWEAKDAATLVEALARGVAEAHRNSVVHRDLKPSNILLTVDGTPKISDFGLAKSVGVDTGLTQNEAILGTASYMAPEQAEGHSSEVGPAADVYALGAILYELLTGRPPFKGSTIFQTLEQVRSDEVVPPRRLLPSLARDLETIALVCLRKEPTRRYGSAEALANDLRRYLDGETILARRSNWVRRSWRWGRRNPLVAGLAASLAIALLTGTAVATYFAMRSADEAGRARYAEANSRAIAENLWIQAKRVANEASRVEAAEGVARQEASRANRLLYVANLQLADQVWSSDAGTARKIDNLLDENCPKAGEEDLREFTWRLVWSRLNERALTFSSLLPARDGSFADDRDLITLDVDGTVRLWDPKTAATRRTVTFGHASSSGCQALAPDGSILARGDFFGATVSLFEAQTGKAAGKIEGMVPLSDLAFSTDGRWLATVWSDRTLRVFEVATRRELFAMPMEDARYQRIVLSAADKQLFVAESNTARGPGIAAYDLATKKVTHIRHGAPVHTLQCPPAGGLLAVGDDFGEVTLWDTASLSHGGRKLFSHSSVPLRLAFTPDGLQLATGGRDGQIIIADVEQREVVGRLKSHRAPITFLAFAPDGSRLFSGDEDGDQKLWPLGAGNRDLGLDVGGSFVSALAFSPDSQLLVTAGDAARVWDLATGKLVRTLADDGSAIISVAFSPDGSMLVTGSTDSSVILWELATGRRLQDCPGRSEIDAADRKEGRDDGGFPQRLRAVSSVAYTPDGKYVIAGHGSRHDQQGSGEYLSIIDQKSFEEVATIREFSSAVSALVVSPDGARLAAVAPDRTVRTWRVGTWQPVRSFPGPAQFHSVAFAPGGGLLAAGDDEGSILCWDVVTGRLVRTLKGHADGVYGLAFSPDGRTLASSSIDRTLKLWEFASGRETVTLQSHSAPIFVLRFSPRGDVLASASDDAGPLGLWSATPLHEIDAARAQTKILEKSRADARRTSTDASPPAQTLDSAVRDALTGAYEFAPGSVLTVTRDGDQLRAELPGRPAISLLAESAEVLRSNSTDVRFRFQRDALGRIESLVVVQEGRELKAVRRSARPPG